MTWKLHPTLDRRIHKSDVEPSSICEKERSASQCYFDAKSPAKERSAYLIEGYTRVL
jgi:hypothetical protein